MNLYIINYLLSLSVCVITAWYYNCLPSNVFDLPLDGVILLFVPLLIAFISTIVDHFLTLLICKIFSIKIVKISFVLSVAICWLIISKCCIYLTMT